MKKFQIIGPLTSKEILIGDDEMLEWKIIKIKDWVQMSHSSSGCNPIPNVDIKAITPEQNKPGGIMKS